MTDDSSKSFAIMSNFAIMNDLKFKCTLNKGWTACGFTKLASVRGGP